jgi:hypothetical protein
MRAEKLVPHCQAEFEALFEAAADPKNDRLQFWEATQAHLSRMRLDMFNCSPEAEAREEWRQLMKRIDTFFRKVHTRVEHHEKLSEQVK